MRGGFGPAQQNDTKLTLAPTVLAKSVYLQAVIHHLESQLLGCGVLKRFNRSVIKLDRCATAHADHVVVVIVIVEVLVPRNAVGQVDLASEAAVGEQLHRAIDRGIADARICFADTSIDILDAAVPFIADEILENQFPVRREFQLLLLEIVQKDLHLGRDGLHFGVILAGKSFKTSL